MSDWFSDIKSKFILNFVSENRWKYLTDGLKVTLIVTFFAVLLGIVIGALIAIVRSTYDKNYSVMRKGFKKTLLAVFNFLCKVYLTVIVQLMIMYYVIFATSNNKILVAVLAFGINSGAYVAEIIRSGIMSIDKGQFEAGRSLGFNYAQTMRYIIIPQAFKNVLPALGNEFIVLLKETSVSGYVALEDLTKGGDIIRGRTYSAFMPLLAVAAIYLVIVMIISKIITIGEKRLRQSER